MSQLATGLQTPDFSGATKPHSDIMKYNFANVGLRQLCHWVIGVIPAYEPSDSTMRLVRPAGRYEVCVKERRGRLCAVFFDYKAINGNSPECI